MVLLHVKYKIKPNKRDEFVAKLREYDLAGEYSKQPGNIKYEYFIPIGEEDVIFVVDAWEDEEACEAHLTSPTSKVLNPLKETYVIDTRVEKYII